MKRLTALLLCLTLLCAVPLRAGATQEEEEEETLAFSIPAAIERLPDETLMGFFTDSVFVGDSISQRFRTYTKDRRVEEPGFLSNAKFLVTQSYLLFVASKNYVSKVSSNLTYQGQEMSLCMIMGKMKPKRVFILLGVNDYIGEKLDKAEEYVTRTVSLIHKYSPDTQIYFQSLTPVTRTFCKRKDYRTMWDQYNVLLKGLSETNDFTYIEIAQGLKDDEGYLPEALAMDKEYHLNNAGVEIWVSELLDFAQSQYEQGLWAPEV